MNAPRSNPPPSQHHWRSAHRARQHDAAHASEDTSELRTLIDHPLVPKGEAELIDTQAGVIRLIEEARAAKVFAYDTEFIGEMTYHPVLCVIQVATSEKVSLIDPLADVDLTLFWELLCDPEVEKIVHAGEQDVEPVLRHLGKGPVNLFDTQIACGFLGMTYPVSLTKLLQEMLGIKLAKGLTFTAWDQRPLSKMQLRYAADDVRYLPAVRAELGARLDKLGHFDWAKEESESLSDPKRHLFDRETQYLKLRGASSLSPANLSVLKELMAWRDAGAQTANLPPRVFLRDEVLLDMARSPVKTPEKFSKVRGLPRPIEQEFGNQLIELTRKALAEHPAGLPDLRQPEPTPTERFRADALYAAAEVICAGQSIDPSLVISRQEASDILRTFLATQDVGKFRTMKGWRRKACGDALLSLVAGDRSLKLTWSDGVLRTETLESRPS